MEKAKKIIQKTGKMFSSSGTKNGAYSVGLTVLVIAVVVVFNMIVSQIPEAYRNIDVSSTKIYDISDTTKDLLSGLNEDVTMNVLAVKEDTDDRITTFLSKYASLSDHIQVEWTDPVLHPSALTENDASENTVVISCDATGKSTTVSFDDILVMDEYSYYYYGSTSYTEFDGEGQLTSAVNYVINDTEKNIYQMTGHGESTLSSTITDLMNKNSYNLSEVNLMMSTSVPEDCDLLLMYAPQTDLSESETELITGYLAEGGNVMVLLGDASGADLPNLESVLETYGITSADGYIADPARCYQGNYYYIFPELSLSGDMASGISSEMVLLTYARGLMMTDPARDTITVTDFMSSSDQAYAVTETSQEQGTYIIGAVATETISSEDDESDEEQESAESSGTAGEELESRFTVISAASLIDQSITDTFTTLENTTVFMNAVTANFDGVQNLSIEAKSLQTEYNTVQHAGLFSFLVIFGIPAAVLIAGFVVWFRRRKA